MTEAVEIMVGSIVVVGVLTRVLLHPVYVLKATQINVQYCRIHKHMLYKSEVYHNAMEARKDICCVKGEWAIDHSTVTRWLKKIRSGCKYFDDQARSSRPTSKDSEAIHQATEANSSTRESIK